MKRPDWIYKENWSKLTNRQRKIMLQNGKSHLNIMFGWLKTAGKTKHDRSPNKPARMPRESQWFREPEPIPREEKDHQY